jgi:hypothetical protein
VWVGLGRDRRAGTARAAPAAPEIA